MDFFIKLLFQHWSFNPYLIAVIGLFFLTEYRGYRYLRSQDKFDLAAKLPKRTSLSSRFLIFIAGGSVLLLILISPLNYWAGYYFWVHMIQHIFLMLVSPFLIVVSAPWSIMYWGLPSQWRYRLRRNFSKSQLGTTLRAIGRIAISPKVAIGLFSITMILWMVPSLFDLAMENPVIGFYGMDLSMFIVGILLFSSVLGIDYPHWPQSSPSGQIAGLMVPAVVMWMIAIVIGMFGQHNWYSCYAHLPGITMSSYGSQQIGAAELWVCGDFSLTPALDLVVKRFLYREEMLLKQQDRELSLLINLTNKN